MMVSNYGASLSQDRIALFTDQELCNLTPLPGGCGSHCAWREDLDEPEGDLAHMMPVFCSPDMENVGCSPLTATIKWALNETSVGVKLCQDTDLTTLGNNCGNIDFSDIKSWIDNKHPLIARLQGHIVAINGYCSSGSAGWILTHDPLKETPEWSVFSASHFKAFWLGPPSAANPRSDKAWWSDDADGDGICDFDEVHRFPTLGKMADSDLDGVEDLNDMREYVFSADGRYAYGESFAVTFGSGIVTFERVPDDDGDSLRKEVDKDNDGDGCPDGLEDANGNGVFDGTLGESNNFISDCEVTPLLPQGCGCGSNS